MDIPSVSKISVVRHDFLADDIIGFIPVTQEFPKAPHEHWSQHWIDIVKMGAVHPLWVVEKVQAVLVFILVS